MRSTGPRRVLRLISAFIVTAVGAALGALLGLVASVVIWSVGSDDTGSDDVSISGLMGVGIFVVPIATVAGVALALMLLRSRRR